MAIPPAGSGIEPKQLDGSTRAVAWAVKQSAQLATRSPDQTPAGIGGIHLMLTTALATGKICEGRNKVSARPDAELLSVCNDALSASDRRAELSAEQRRCFRSNPEAAVRENAKDMRRLQTAEFAALDAVGSSLKVLSALHPTTREGLLRKARTILLVYSAGYFTASFRDELARSLVEDLIHLVPTLIDERGRSLPDRSASGTEGVA